MAKSTTATATTKKTECPVTLEQFQAAAKPLAIKIGDHLTSANIKAPFSTGSFGWNTQEKVTLMVGGVPVKCQVGINVIVVASKEASK